MKRRTFVLSLAALAAGCGDPRSHTHGVYMLVDTSGTYAEEIGKAQLIVNYLLGTLQPGDSLAVARVRSRSFSEKDIPSPPRQRPPRPTREARFRDQVDPHGLRAGRCHRHHLGADPGCEFLKETGAGRNHPHLSDMRGAGQVHLARFPIDLKDIRVVRELVQLKTDNVDPRANGRLRPAEARQGRGSARVAREHDIEDLTGVKLSCGRAWTFPKEVRMCYEDYMD